MAYRVTSACLLAVAASLAGCGDDNEATDAGAGETEAATGATEGQDAGEPGSSGTSEDGGSGDSSGSADSGDSGGEPAHVDLFECAGVPASCAQIVQHIDPEPHEALECAGMLVTSGQPGVISALDAPGPDIDETESLILVLGDGTALVQTRERHCPLETDLDETCDSATLAWEPASEHQLCTIEITAELQAACDPACETDCNCVWEPFYSPLSDCQPVTDWTCDDAAAALAAG